MHTISFLQFKESTSQPNLMLTHTAVASTATHTSTAMSIAPTLAHIHTLSPSSSEVMVTHQSTPSQLSTSTDPAIPARSHSSIVPISPQLALQHPSSDIPESVNVSFLLM